MKLLLFLTLLAAPLVAVPPAGPAWPHLIITSRAIAEARTDVTVQTLRDWRTKNGLPSRILTTEEITRTFPGRDPAEKIRNAIIDAHAKWGVRYVLLGGDASIIPVRLLQSQDNTPDQAVPSDLYYGCLDGTFNKNNNKFYGEYPDDEPDFIFDVTVGRVPARNAADMADWVFKVLSYERSPINAAFHTRAMIYTSTDVGKFAPAWRDPYFCGDARGNVVDWMMNQPAEPVLKRYRSGNCGAIILGSHGTEEGLGYVDKKIADTLANGPGYFFMSSLACLAGNFEKDCIAQHLVVGNRRGGAFAAFLNSRVGFAGGNAMNGIMASELDLYFSQGVTELGPLSARSREALLKADPKDSMRRWSAYEHNLFGDPASKWRTLFATALAAHFPCEDSPTTRAIADASGNGATGRLLGRTQFAPGRWGAGLAFSGPGDAVECQVTPSFPTAPAELTLAVWVKPTVFADGVALIAKGTPAGTAFALELNKAGAPVFRANGGNVRDAEGKVDVTSTLRLQPGTWQHVAVTYSASTHKVRFFLDGKEDASAPDVTLYLADAPGPLALGRNFNGLLDDIRVYGRALSPEELVVAARRGQLVTLSLTGDASAGLANQADARGPLATAAGVTWPATSAGGGAVFDGTTSCVSLPGNATPLPRRRLTLAGWVKPERLGAPMTIVSQGGNDAPFTLRVLADGRLAFSANEGTCPGGVGSGSWQSVVRLTPGIWQHVAVTYDGTHVRFHFNGKPDNATRADLVLGRTTAPILIGTGEGSSPSPFAGSLRQVGVYVEALTAPELATLAAPEPGVIRSAQKH